MREADPSGFQLAPGQAAQGRDAAPGCRGGRRAAATSGCPSSATGPATSRSSSGWPPSTRTATTSRIRIPEPHRPEDVVVPPYLPDVPEVRKDLALYYDEIGRLDHYVGDVLAELDRQGIAEDTLVPVPQRQRPAVPALQDDALRQRHPTPFIVRWPGHIAPGSHCGRLVSTIDIAPTFLKLAGLEPVSKLPGQGLLAPLPGPEGEGPRPDLRRAELARLSPPGPGGPVGAVQVHQER